MTTHQWRKLTRWIRKVFPVASRVILKRRKIKKNCAVRTVHSIPSYPYAIFRLYINSNATVIEQTDALLHEWAHILSEEETHSHAGNWGILHGKIIEEWGNIFGSK
jgi:hypothetical protein